MAEKHPNVVVVKETTDWDYNVQHCPDVCLFLERLGFTEINGNPNYKDSQAVKFYQCGVNSTIVTRLDLNIYKKAFEMMSVDAYIHRHWKSSPFLVAPFDKTLTKEYFNALFEEAKNDR